jgi:Ca-activated chloride channel family protein
MKSALQNRQGVSLVRIQRNRELFCFVCVLLLFLLAPGLWAQQDDPLNRVTIPPPPAKKTVPGLEAPPVSNANPTTSLSVHGPSRFRVTVDQVLVPVTVTDPLGRLVTGLDKPNFTVYEDNVPQKLNSFFVEDAPVTIGVVLDLSGSMADKIDRARKAVLSLLQTSNPQDEYFVIAFNDRPELLADFTNSVDDIESGLLTTEAQHRTALLDAIYMGMDKMKYAKYDRKALIVVSDGGDNRSRYTEHEVRNAVAESDVQLFAMGIYDFFVSTPEEENGPILLNDLCKATGGRMFPVHDLDELQDVATRISASIRNEYVLGYKPLNEKKDGKWRKLKVALTIPKGLPPLTVSARTGYYAPTQ